MDDGSTLALIIVSFLLFLLLSKAGFTILGVGVIITAIWIALERYINSKIQKYERELRHLRDEVARLSQEVSELREEIRRGGWG